MVVVAQLVEHLVVVQEVAGSSPVGHPKKMRLEPRRSFSLRLGSGLIFVLIPRGQGEEVGAIPGHLPLAPRQTRDHRRSRR